MTTSRGNLVGRSDRPAMNWRDYQRDIFPRYCWLAGGFQVAAVVDDEWANGGDAFLAIGEWIVVGLAIAVSAVAIVVFRRETGLGPVARLVLTTAAAAVTGAMAYVSAVAWGTGARCSGRYS